MTRTNAFIIAAVALFVIAFLISVNVVTGNGSAFLTSGLACFAASFWS